MFIAVSFLLKLVSCECTSEVYQITKPWRVDNQPVKSFGPIEKGRVRARGLGCFKTFFLTKELV